jgi:hypothetical protein
MPCIVAVFYPHVVLCVELVPDKFEHGLIGSTQLNSYYMELASLLGWWAGVWVGGVMGIVTTQEDEQTKSKTLQLQIK